MKKRYRCTDLALEAHQLWQENTGKTTLLSGVQAQDRVREGFSVSTVRILDQQGSDALGKPPGTYVTLTLDETNRMERGAFSRAVRAVAQELSPMLPEENFHSPVLVAGLGNRAITPDAIGPKAQEYILVTRHLVEQLPQQFSSFRPVASVSTGVLGNTGMESGEIVESLCRSLKPCCVLVVDALASRSTERLCRTIQLADTGITPGSGVGNHRHALTKETLGVPVIAIGVPTVVDGATLAADLLDLDEPPQLQGERKLLVTPKDIDSQVTELSRIIGYAISAALQPGLTVEDLEMMLN